MSFTFDETHPPYGAWRHDKKPVWVVEYSETRDRSKHYQTYKAIHAVPNSRKPWSINNRRVGTEDGFKTLEQALEAGEMA